MTLPNFLIVGAAKSGTTTLYYCLRQHPQVYMNPYKETNFFAFEGEEVRFCGPGDEEFCKSTITSPKVYEQQFEAVSKEVAIGEASPWYLYSERAARNIHRHIPDAKLIIVLRNPVDRAFSSYLHAVRDGREHLTFEGGLLAEEERIAQNWEFIWHYQKAGFYTSQIERFLNLFPPEQIRIYLYDDLLTDFTLFFRDLCKFLDIDPDFTVDTSLRHNATGIPKNQLLGRLVLQQNPVKSTIKLLIPRQLRYNAGLRIKQHLLKKPSLSEETRIKLLDSYVHDISSLQDLIHRDLSPWLKGF